MISLALAVVGGKAAPTPTVQCTNTANAQTKYTPPGAGRVNTLDRKTSFNLLY